MREILELDKIEEERGNGRRINMPSQYLDIGLSRSIPKKLGYVIGRTWKVKTAEEHLRWLDSGGIWEERRGGIKENRDSDLQRVIALVHLAIIIHGLIFFRTPRGLCRRGTFASSDARHCLVAPVVVTT